jgi:hypothetical protein
VGFTVLFSWEMAEGEKKLKKLRVISYTMTYLGQWIPKSGVLSG